MHRKILLILGILPLVAVLIGWCYVTYSASVGQKVSTAEESQEQGTQADGRLVVCYGYADLEGGVSSLHPSQAGRVAEVLVKEESAVKAGAALLRLDDRAARFRVAEAQALLDKALAEQAKAAKAVERHRVQIAEQEAAVKAAHKRIAVARQTLAARKAQQRTDSIGRARNDPVLAEEIKSADERVSEFLAAEEVEENRLKYLRLRDPQAFIDAAKAEVATMRARLQQAEQVVEEHTLRAPESGRVLRLSVTAGELVNLQPRRMAVQFCADRPRFIRAEVEQVFAARLKAGLPADVEDDSRSGTTWRGRVARIADWYAQRRLVAEEQLQLKDVRTLECLIALEPGQEPVRIGQRMRVTIRQPPPAGREGLSQRGPRKEGETAPVGPVAVSGPSLSEDTSRRRAPWRQPAPPSPSLAE